MNIRYPIVVIVLVVSLLLFFGGWSVYQQFEVRKPLKFEISKMENVELNSIEFNKQQMVVNVSLSEVKELDQTYRKIYDIANNYNNRNKEIRIQIAEEQDPRLHNIWDEAQFTIHESIATHAYSKIPSFFEQIKISNPEIEYKISMDELFVYITIYNGSKEMYAVVPRLVNAEEVKDNE